MFCKEYHCLAVLEIWRFNSEMKDRENINIHDEYQISYININIHDEYQISYLNINVHNEYQIFFNFNIQK